MRGFKRGLWFCFAGCCCAGLWLRAGETARSADANPTAAASAADGVKYGQGGMYCPQAYFGQFDGVHYYMVISKSDCFTIGLMTTTEYHEIGRSCPDDCPDPIYSTYHPLPIPKDLALPQQAEKAEPLSPKPDPRFSGVLR